MAASIELEQYKTELFRLAEDPDGLSTLRQCIHDYYIDIGIPIVEVHHPFIAVPVITRMSKLLLQ